MDKYHHGNLRAALLKAAFHLVGKIGIEGFTLREVARRAGVSHNAPYRHFKSKEDLIGALATEGLRQLDEALRLSIANTEDPSERLRLASRAYLEFALKNPSRFGVMYHSSFDRKAPAYVEAYRQSLTLLSEMIGAHEALAMDTQTAVELFWASIHGIAELGIARRLREGQAEDLRRLVDRAVETLLAGLTHRQQPTPVGQL